MTALARKSLLQISLSIDNNNNNNNNGQGRIGGPRDQEEPPPSASVAEDPTPEAKKTCLRDDDVFIDDDDDDDDDEWTLLSMCSEEEDMTDLIQNGIKRIGDGDIDDDDDFVDEVAGCKGVTFSITDESTTDQVTKLNISITDEGYPTEPKPAVAKEGTSNKRPSEQHNVPKLSNLPSSFSKVAF